MNDAVYKGLIQQMGQDFIDEIKFKEKTMNETKHSPGPWEAWNDDGTGTLPCVLADQVTAYGNFYVAQCNNYPDAVLIAAAPDLLAWLEQIVFRLDEGDEIHPDMLHHVKAAIAKAKGEEVPA